MNNIVLADKAGFCFGVKRAVDEALASQKGKAKKIYTLGPLIHNKDVISRLQDTDIHTIDINDIYRLEKGDTVILRSHGVGKDVINLLKQRQLDIIDATCPYVKHIHNIVEKYYNMDYKIIIIGDPIHPEVIGINGWCENSAIVLEHGYAKGKLPGKVCVVCQTTEKQESFKRAIDIISDQCREFVVFNTICSATGSRQSSAAELAAKMDVMIVIGDKSSSNTNKLYEICKNKCKDTFYIENHESIDEEVYSKINSGSFNIGITAGASTPDWVIDKVISKLKGDKDHGK